METKENKCNYSSTSDDDILIEHIKKKKTCYIKPSENTQVSGNKNDVCIPETEEPKDNNTNIKKEKGTVIRNSKIKGNLKEKDNNEKHLSECKIIKKSSIPQPGYETNKNSNFSNNGNEKNKAVEKNKRVVKGKNGAPEKKEIVKNEKSEPRKVEKKAISKIKKDTNKKPKKLIKKSEENFEPINRWWEKIDDQTDKQWQYLEHRGIIFSPPYVPHNIPIFYKSVKVELNVKAEELATYWCSVIGSDYCTKEKFILNFFKTFITNLEKDNIIRKENENKLKKGDISNFNFIDFMPIKEHLVKQREEKLNRSKEEKEEEKKIRMEKELPYTYALVDWIREKVSSNKAEPPGLFRGRGEHPKQGLLKKRIFPEDVVINISKDAPVPRLYDDMCGHNWGDTYHDNNVTWLAYYKDSINDQLKYTFLSAQSKFKGYKDFLKYENARKLKSCVHKIREDYKNKMKSKNIINKQLGTAVYLIDFLALRVGGEKDIDEEADTVGCCSLRVEHVNFAHDVPIKNEDENANRLNKGLLPKNLDDISEDECFITLDFLGKDSIRYFNTVKIDKQAYINMIIFCKNKSRDEGVFDQINCSKLNDYLKEIMPTLSAKVFRTYNASITLDQQLKRIKEIHGKPEDSVYACSIDIRKRKKRKTENVTSSTSILSDDSDSQQNEKGKNEEVRGYAEDVKAMEEAGGTGENEKNDSTAEKCLLKKNGEDDKNSPIEVDVSNVNDLINFFNNANREVAILCNHQRSVPKQHDTTMSKIKKQIEIFSEDIKEYKKYLQYLKKGDKDQKFTFVSKVVALDGTLRPNKVKENMKEESCKKKLITLIKKVEMLQKQMKVRDDNKTIALGTSKINYMDPRITVAFCKRFEIPIEKIFNRSLRLKFPWAMFVTKNFCF
ncbi:topoisomerase I, putative [Plasmodium ovale wallikeri]|uniref:DNA topoisomerase 1 n=2 Tax=Plasmodium ovale TaxID=36330 RepID=A0A1A8YZ19_PLAOA|nr:topoisomerase I, putative [Plasmodium ovale wallikeri]SBT36839.1 topoisomerase I, putative [Plasmodium ovale wallikeri]SBT73996.1 topoisomerase I, putative [Plasmodium ovale]